jgi:hypothetical protein
MRSSLRFLAIPFIASLLLVSCGNPAEKAAENAAEKAIEQETGGKADVDIKNGTTRVQTKDGVVTVGEQQLPADWPKDVPVYPGAKVQVSGTSNTNGAASMFTIPGGKADVVSFYKQKLVEEGWVIDVAADMGASSIVSASKDQRTIAVQIAESGEQTTVTIGIDTKKD